MANGAVASAGKCERYESERFDFGGNQKVARMPGKGEKGGDGRRPDHRLPSPFFSLFKSLPPSPTPKKSLDVMVRPLGKSEVSSYAFDAPSPPENAA